jgi:chitodextrinase
MRLILPLSAVAGAGGDTEAPTAPTSFTATQTPTSIFLGWAAATDNVGVTHYHIERSAAGAGTWAEINATTHLNYEDSSGTPATTYDYRVRAKDAAGNFGPYSSIATATTAGGAGAGEFRFFRLNFTRFVSGGYFVPDMNSTGTLRVSEFEIMVGATAHPTSDMTDASTPSPLVASANSELSGGGFEAWRAFEGTVLDAGGRWLSDNVAPPIWLKIDLGAGNEIEPTAYKIAPDSGAGGGNVLTSWTFEGSNTGAFAGEQTVLDTQINRYYESWTGGVLETFTLPDGSSAPGAPSSLAVIGTLATEATLTWTASPTSGASYKLYRSTTAGFTPSNANLVWSGIPPGTTGFVDRFLASGTTYYYVLKAYSPGGDSAGSNEASGTTA